MNDGPNAPRGGAAPRPSPSRLTRRRRAMDLPRAAGLSPGGFVSMLPPGAPGFHVWPHTFAPAYTAKSGDVLRRNAAAGRCAHALNRCVVTTPVSSSPPSVR